MKSSLRTTLAVLFAFAAALLAGCGGSKTPPADAVRSAVAQALPPYLSVQDVTFEPIGNGAYNFKAQAKCGEALLVEAQSTDAPIRLIKQVNSSGESLAVYGRFAAEKQVDQWRIVGVEVTNGVAALGRPRGDFSGAFIAGSAEAAKAISDYRAEQERQTREAAARVERERIANAERAAQKKAEDEAAAREQEKARAERKRTLLALVAKGATYSGTLKRDNEIVPINARVTKVLGSQFIMEFTTPNYPGEVSTWNGSVDADAEKHPINLGGVYVDDAHWRFRRTAGAGVIKLSPGPDSRLIGEVSNSNDVYSDYTLSLEPASQ